jgi:tetratricopeptide (TPR) repeat protein
LKAHWLVFVLVANLGSIAHAQREGSEARKQFEEGTKAFNLGEFTRAVQHYRAAYQAKPDPVFLYNIAQAYRQANDLPQALFFYRSFLRNMPNAPNRREVEDRIGKLEHQLAQQKALALQPPNNLVAPDSAPPPSEPEPEAKPVAKPAPTPPQESTPAIAANNAPPEAKPARKSRVALIVGVTLGAVAAVAIGVGLGVGLSGGGGAPTSHFGNTVVTFQ